MRTIIALLFTALILVTPISATDREEFETWLSADLTDMGEYIDGQYQCVQFSDDLIKNATAAGFSDVHMAQVKHVVFSNGTVYNTGASHALVYVSFGDNDIELYDPQTDEPVSLLYVEAYKKVPFENTVLVLTDYTLYLDDITTIWYFDDDVLYHVLFYNDYVYDMLEVDGWSS